MKILDMSAGFRHIWADKNHPLVTFLDRRAEVKPTIVCDTRAIPLGDGLFDLVVFDPPHENTGSGKLSRTYGKADRADILSTVYRSSREAWRVTKPNALMAFKWNDCAWPLEKVLPMLQGWEPLFAHGLRLPGRHRTQTYWALLLRRDKIFPLPPGVE
jgi:hypothetical protein